MNSVISFREVEIGDFEFILDIYNYYVLNSTATFHLEPLSIIQLQDLLPKNHAIYKTYIIFYSGESCGYCYLNYWKPRQAYNRSAEITIYLKPHFHGKGIGKATLLFLEEQAKNCGISNLLGVITAENMVSINLFKSMGYQNAGVLKNIGEKFGKLLDVATFQKELTL